MFAAVGAFFAANLKKIIGGAVVMGAALFLAFQWGRADMASTYHKKLAKAELEWADKVTAASRNAYDRGLEDAKKDFENEQSVDDLARAAEGEAWSGDTCIPGDLLERLRQFQ